MTSLNPLAILLGKSTSRLCGALLLLLGQFPFTIFAITLGGVSLGQIVAVYCTLGSYTFLLCNLALLGSVLARRTAGAATFCVCVLAVLLGSGPFFGFVHDWLPRFPRLQSAAARASDVLWNATPIARLEEVLGTTFVGAPAGWQVASNLALGLGSFLLAWAAFERSCDRAPDSSISGGAAHVDAVPSRRSRHPRVWKNALLWKDFHFVCGGSVGFAIRTICYAFALLPFVCREFDFWPDLAAISPVVSGLASFVLTIDVALLSSRIFGLELPEQTLPALATLPYPMKTIAYHKALGGLLAFAPVVVVIVAVQFLALQFPAFTRGRLPFSMTGMLVIQALSGWVRIVLLVHVVAWLSLYMKRGAAPVGWLATYLVGSLISMICMMAFAMNAFRLAQSGTINRFGPASAMLYLSPAVTTIVSIVAIFIIHVRILRRLEVLAGES
jgi:hypothetical protein